MSGGVPAGDEVQRLRSALVAITSLRPLGNVETCKEPRKLVERMERMALLALDGKQAPIYPRATPTPTPTPPIEGRDVERVAIREYLIACADECDHQGSLYAQSGNVCAVPKLRAEAKAYRNAARMVDEQAHGSYRSAALQALGERG